MTVQQVGDLLAVTARHVYKLIDCGRLKAVRLGRPVGPTSRGRWRIYEASLREYLGEPVAPSRASADDRRLQGALASMGFESVGGRVRRVGRGAKKENRCDIETG
ncbi:MAG: helix-turn-helix domain-containing protein [Phycisphaerae bacterium]